MSEKSRRDAALVGRFPEPVADVFDHYEAHGTAILRMLSRRATSQQAGHESAEDSPDIAHAREKVRD
jgi:hypothetical protein